MGRLLLYAHAAAVQGLAVVAVAGTLVVSGDQTVGGVAVGRGTLAQATARFGAPTSASAEGGGVTCKVTWRPLGLTMSFLDFANHACRDGGLVIATMTSRAHWRTSHGLRVGDAVTRLRALYPHARLHADGYWLVVRQSCQEVGAQLYPGLLARVGAGRVRALVVTAGVCE
ncbi:MAG TPA: hypothetical protein VGU02_04620 [Gaiellaceae bacterium]|nr:hypothetical protein [Gaiellaceae bacterium]